MITLLTLLCLAPNDARAADAYNAHGFTLVPGDGDLHDPLGMWRPELQVRRSFGVSVLAEYAKAPLVQYTTTGDEVTQQALIDNLLGFNLGGAYALNRRVALTLALPIWAHAEDLRGDGHAALGDLRFAAPIGLLVPRKDAATDERAAHVMLSLIPFANLPSGNADLYLGSGGFGGGGVLALGVGSEIWQIYANGGAEVTPKVTDLSNLHGGTFLKANLGASLRVVENLAIRAEGTLNTALAPNDVAWTESPAEAILSARLRTDNGLRFTLGGATALTPGAGAARYRLFAGGGWTFGKDADPVLVPVVAAVDPCALSVLVQDPLGKPIVGAQVTADNRVSTSKANGKAGFDGCEAGKTSQPTAQAQGYQPGASEAFLLMDGPNERIIVLQPLDSQLKIIVLDENGLPKDARVRFLEGPASQPMVQVGLDGEETITLQPGDWTVLVAAPTHVPQEARVWLDPGEFETLTVRFTADKPLAVCSETVILHNINFDFDIDTPREDALPVLKIVANSLKDCPEVEVVIGGHTDSKGTDNYNLDLSRRRMNSVKEILIGYRVAERRLQAVGYGETRPISTNNTATGRALNRRVEFVPIKTAASTPAPAGDQGSNK